MRVARRRHQPARLGAGSCFDDAWCNGGLPGLHGIFMGHMECDIYSMGRTILLWLCIHNSSFSPRAFTASNWCILLTPPLSFCQLASLAPRTALPFAYVCSCRAIHAGRQSRYAARVCILRIVAQLGSGQAASATAAAAARARWARCSSGLLWLTARPSVAEDCIHDKRGELDEQAATLIRIAHGRLPVARTAASLGWGAAGGLISNAMLGFLMQHFVFFPVVTCAGGGGCRRWPACCASVR